MQVMGRKVREFLFVTGYLRDDLQTQEKAKNLRTLMTHYHLELTGENTANRLLTDTLASHVTSIWCRLHDRIAHPGKIIKGDIGDDINAILMHVDGELLPGKNSVVSKLMTLKHQLGEKDVTNASLIQVKTKKSERCLLRSKQIDNPI